MNNNYYELLGVAPNASLEEITSAYQAKLDKLSPENFRGHRQFANAQIKLLKKAFQVLKKTPQKNSVEIESAKPVESIKTPNISSGHAKKDKQWQGFYSDANIKLILLAANTALESANQHIANYPLPIINQFIGIPRLHSHQAENLQIDTQSLIQSIHNADTPDEKVRDEYLKFIKDIDEIANDKTSNPLAADLIKKNIIDTLSQSISFTLFNKTTPRLVTPIKKSLNKYLTKINTKLKVPKPGKRR